MLLDFNVSNFRSIKNELFFSMETGAYLKKFPNNVLNSNNIKLLKSSVLFGFNGAGKSNILKSLYHLKKVVTFESSKIDKSLPYDPFAFSKDFNGKDTVYNIRFIKNENLYEYHISYNSKRISEEYLIRNDEKYFDRKQNIYPESFNSSHIRENKTVIYYGQDINDQICTEVYLWFVDDLVFFNLKDVSDFIYLLENQQNKDKFLTLMQYVDTNIVDVEILKYKLPDNLIKKLKKNYPDEDIPEDTQSVIFKHKLDEKGIAFGFESSGTQKMILLVLLLIESMNKGKIIVCDEFDIFFHQNIIESLIRIFNHENSCNQYILSSHQLDIMDLELRTDQIWIVDKDKDLSTYINSIFDFEKRTDVKISTQYLQDRFNGLPIIDIDNLEREIFGYGKKI